MTAVLCGSEAEGAGGARDGGLPETSGVADAYDYCPGAAHKLGGKEQEEGGSEARGAGEAR